MPKLQHRRLKNADAHPIGYIKPYAQLPAAAGVAEGTAAFDPVTGVFYLAFNGRWVDQSASINPGEVRNRAAVLPYRSRNLRAVCDALLPVTALRQRPVLLQKEAAPAIPPGVTREAYLAERANDHFHRWYVFTPMSADGGQFVRWIHSNEANGTAPGTTDPWRAGNVRIYYADMAELYNWNNTDVWPAADAHRTGKWRDLLYTSNIIGIARAGDVVTVTTDTAGIDFDTGRPVDIAGAPGDFNGRYEIAAQASSTQFTCTGAGAIAAHSLGAATPEGGDAVPIFALSRSALGTVTATLADNSAFTADHTVTIAGCTEGADSFNGVFTIGSLVGSTQLTWPQAGAEEAPALGTAAHTVTYCRGVAYQGNLIRMIRNAGNPIVTCTLDAPGGAEFPVGTTITISGCTGSGEVFNGTHVVNSPPGESTFTFAFAGDGSAIDYKNIVGGVYQVVGAALTIPTVEYQATGTRIDLRFGGYGNAGIVQVEVLDGATEIPDRYYATGLLFEGGKRKFDSLRYGSSVNHQGSELYPFTIARGLPYGTYTVRVTPLRETNTLSTEPGYCYYDFGVRSLDDTALDPAAWDPARLELVNSSCVLGIGTLEHALFVRPVDSTDPADSLPACNSHGSEDGPLSVTFLLDGEDITDAFYAAAAGARWEGREIIIRQTTRPFFPTDPATPWADITWTYTYNAGGVAVDIARAMLAPARSTAQYSLMFIVPHEYNYHSAGVGGYTHAAYDVGRSGEEPVQAIAVEDTAGKVTYFPAGYGCAYFRKDRLAYGFLSNLYTVTPQATEGEEGDTSYAVQNVSARYPTHPVNPIAAITRTVGAGNDRTVVLTLASGYAVQYLAGERVTVAGVADGSFNGSYEITARDVTAKTVTYHQTAAPGNELPATTSSGGTASTLYPVSQCYAKFYTSITNAFVDGEPIPGTNDAEVIIPAGQQLTLRQVYRIMAVDGPEASVH